MSGNRRTGAVSGCREHKTGAGMKLGEGQEAREGLKLGIVRLGKAGGKTKYCLLEERDLGLVHRYTFEARTQVDRNGGGAKILAYCYRYEEGKASGQYVHNMLWERHRGGIAPGFRVIHSNCITIDNRLANLRLVPQQMAEKWCGHSSHSCSLPAKASSYPQPLDLESSLYWVAIQQLPWDPTDSLGESSVLRYYNNDGEVVEEEDDSYCYYECRYAPCIGMEKELREFSICGRCQEARYCGPGCQQRDWAQHKRVCRERRRPFPLLHLPDTLDR